MESLSWFHQRRSPVVFLPRARPWIHHSGQENGVRELARGCGHWDSKSHRNEKGGVRKISESKRRLANKCKGYTMGRSRSCPTVQMMAVRIRGQDTCPRSCIQYKLRRPEYKPRQADQRSSPLCSKATKAIWFQTSLQYQLSEENGATARHFSRKRL